MPPAGGAAGVGGAGAPQRAAAASWGRLGGWTRRGGGVRAQLSESARKLRRAAAARSTAQVAGLGQRCLHAWRGRRASSTPSPAPRAWGSGGATAAGVPGAPGCPSLHRRSPRAHWPRRSDHPGRSPLRPPRTNPRRGGGRRPLPSRSCPQTEPGAKPPLPGQPLGRPRGPRFHRISRAGWGRVAEEGAGAREEGSRSDTPLGESGSTLLAEGSESGHRSSPLRRTAQSWPLEDPGSTLAPGYFPQQSEPLAGD